MTTRTLAQIEADLRSLEVERAAVSLPLLEQALAALADTAELTATLTTIRDGLPSGPGREALGHILTVLTNGPLALNQQADQARALLAASQA
jgi:hypothetical protein